MVVVLIPLTHHRPSNPRIVSRVVGGLKVPVAEPMRERIHEPPLNGVTHHPEPVGSANPGIPHPIGKRDGKNRVQEIGKRPKPLAVQPVHRELQIRDNTRILSSISNETGQGLFVRLKLPEKDTEHPIPMGAVGIPLGVRELVMHPVHADPSLGVDSRDPAASFDCKASEAGLQGESPMTEPTVVDDRNKEHVQHVGEKEDRDAEGHCLSHGTECEVHEFHLLEFQYTTVY